MSIKAMSWYWEHSQQDGHKLLLLLALSDWSDDNGECYPSIASIAKRIRRKTRAAQLTINDLEDEGEILVYQGMGKGRDGMRTPLYYLLKYREAQGIVTPPMIIEAAKHYREQSRKQGERGATLRGQQGLPLEDDTPLQQIAPGGGATDYTPTGAVDCTPPPATDYTGGGAVDYTGGGATRCTQNHQLEPSIRTVSNKPPPPLATHRVKQPAARGASLAGGGSVSPSSAPKVLPQSSDTRHAAIIALIIELIAANALRWGGIDGFLAGLKTQDAARLLAWLWVWDLLGKAYKVNRFDQVAATEADRVISEYARLFSGIHNPVGHIRAKVNGGDSANLTPPDAARLKEIISVRANNLQQAL